MSRTSRSVGCPWRFHVVLILALGMGSPTPGAEEQPTIRLRSNEAADACLAEMSCMRRLFLEATLGKSAVPTGEPQRLLKWTGPARIASFAGDRLPTEAQLLVDQTLRDLSLIGKAAGADLATARASEVVNLVLLISDDFIRDRDDAFLEFLSTVFAGGVEIYDQLLIGSSPICDSLRFIESGAMIGGGLAMAASDVEAQTLERCISRTALQMLGLNYPMRSEVDSVLNPKSNRHVWTSIDYVLLKMLYDPLIRPGMGSDALMDVFPQVYKNAFSPSS